MTAELAVAVIAGIVALSSALISVRGSLKSSRVASEIEQRGEEERRRHDLQKSTLKYREPLANAAFDLQSRLYNILRQGFFDAYFVHGDERGKAYAIDSTLFLFCQYFCWSEIIRRDIQLIDLGNDEKTKELRDRQLMIQRTMATDGYDRSMMVFTLEQREIGEKMISDRRDSDCIGYADFLTTVMRADLTTITFLRKEIERLAIGSARPSERMMRLQSALVDLVDFLDPKGVVAQTQLSY